jgi:hypothetical protein
MVVPVLIPVYLSVKYLVSDPGVELVRVRLPRLVELQGNLCVHAYAHRKYNSERQSKKLLFL